MSQPISRYLIAAAVSALIAAVPVFAFAWLHAEGWSLERDTFSLEHPSGVHILGMLPWPDRPTPGQDAVRRNHNSGLIDTGKWLLIEKAFVEDGVRYIIPSAMLGMLCLYLLDRSKAARKSKS